ncbi:exosortase A [Nitratidesulfovibrio sp.]|uniref:exosortase A n=1 Tax=Nitratidesulfovibrio sp. TaxID=2802297 RepID=UPI00333EEAE3
MTSDTTFDAALRRNLLHWVPLAALFIVVYHSILSRMVGDWMFDPNYSHGFFVPCISAWFVMQRLPELRAAQMRPSWWGLVPLLLGFAMLLFGAATTELFSMRASLVPMLIGTVQLLYGWRVLRILLLPLLFLLFMVPLPYTVYDALALPLKALVSASATGGMKLLGLPVLREGNVIIFPNITLEVVDACSGLRSLVTLLALGTAFAFLFLPPGWRRGALMVGTIPIAVAANTLRVFMTGVLARYAGPAAAEGFFHEFAGLAVFATAMALTACLGWALRATGDAAATKGGPHDG